MRLRQGGDPGSFRSDWSPPVSAARSRAATTGGRLRPGFAGAGGPSVHVLPASDPRERHALRCVGFLFSAYRCGAWYFEVAELVRKFLLTAVVAVVAPGSAAQVTLGMALAWAFMMLCAGPTIALQCQSPLTGANAAGCCLLCTVNIDLAPA